MLLVEIKLKMIYSGISSMAIMPFFQGVDSMKISLLNITSRAKDGRFTASGLDFMWKSLEDKINILLKTLQGSVMLQIEDLLVTANSIFSSHNTTMYQHAEIYEYLITSFRLVNITVRARMQQQIIALNQLTNLASEMQKYVTMATANANSVLAKKYDLKQKIQLSINAAKQASNLAITTNALAFNLTLRLTPVYQRGQEVESYASTCVEKINSWLQNATSTLMYAQKTLSNIAVSIPDYAQVNF